MATSVATIGVPTAPAPNGSIPLRREIRDLQANYKDQWNLYLLGLTDLQQQPVTNLLSYYQVSGIHGEPYVPYSGVQGDTGAPFGGYCTHSSIIFTTWHRPYVALYEQALYASVGKIATRFTSQALRARTKQIRNPLYSFRFDGISVPRELSVDSYWARFPETKRAPDSRGNSRNSLVASVLANEAASLRSNVSLVLLSYHDFDAFSNNAWNTGQPVGRYGSLEDIHNEIHDKLGQGGHMASLDVSAFDPVFWLHHINVDRLWALWQAINPSAFAIGKVAAAREANFTIAAGEEITANSGLEPFYHAGLTNFWNSNEVKWTTPFGHAYPETQRWLFASDDAYQRSIRQAITTLYGANTVRTFFAPAEVQSTLQSTSATVPASAPIAPTTSMPEPTTSMPEPTTSMPEPTTSMPEPTTSMPEPTTSMPEPMTSMPEGFTNKRAGHGGSAPRTATPVAEPAKPRSFLQRLMARLMQLIGSAKRPVDIAVSKVAVIRTSSASHKSTPTNMLPSKSRQVEQTPSSRLGVPARYSHLFPNDTYFEWVVNLRTVKHALGQTFRVFVFLGDFDPEPAKWPTEPNVVGRFTVLGRAGDTPCDKCRTDQEEELVVSGSVPITKALLQDIVDKEALNSLNPEDVVPYLTRHLHWRVTLFDGSEQPRSEVPGLKVGIVSTRVSVDEDGVPVYSAEWQSYPEVTDGRPAGVDYTETMVLSDG
ncbi:Di-copper centre-containing protein [Sporormia fimetaria CBS 119925]|uniref:tyrosinase n=1 Tax=Sporormia fimetaria CBS 119925 TaxID=1340428 RepID=A0A6A6VK76_9PLEO|nr:Di-copper centre-containing protein [Sporormia fimetaria CBS 119925]